MRDRRWRRNTKKTVSRRAEHFKALKHSKRWRSSVCYRKQGRDIRKLRGILARRGSGQVLYEGFTTAWRNDRSDAMA